MTVSIFYLYRYAQALFTCVSTLNRHHWSSWHCCVYIGFGLPICYTPNLGAYECQPFLPGSFQTSLLGVNIEYGGRPNDSWLMIFATFCLNFVPISLRIPLLGTVRFPEGYRKFGIPKLFMCVLRLGNAYAWIPNNSGVFRRASRSTFDPWKSAFLEVPKSTRWHILVAWFSIVVVSNMFYFYTHLGK